jgi:hypothetical protein
MATCTVQAASTPTASIGRFGKYWQQVLAASTDKNRKIGQLEVLARQAVKDLTKG